jgi:hypothetical protein
MRRRPRSQSKKLSEAEKRQRTQQREQSLAAVPQLLYSRRQTQRALGGISISTIIRLENAGKLDKVALAGVPNGQVYHRVAQVTALAEGGSNA